MTVGRDVVLGLQAAARMLVGDARALTLIAPDRATVWHSFLAAAICLPANAAMRWVAWREQGMPSARWHAAGLNLALYAIGWAGFLLLCRAILGAAGQLGVWPRLVAVWNWCNLAQYAVMLAATLFELFGAGAFVLNVVALVSLFWGCWIEFRVLRPLVAGRAALAGALVGLDVAVGLSLQLATTGLGG